MVFVSWIDYFSPGGGERSGICAAVIRCISCLCYNIEHLQTMVGTDGAALGQASFISKKSCEEGKGKQFCFSQYEENLLHTLAVQYIQEDIWGCS